LWITLLEEFDVGAGVGGRVAKHKSGFAPTASSQIVDWMNSNCFFEFCWNDVMEKDFGKVLKMLELIVFL
jgi:hypothetical protein